VIADELRDGAKQKVYYCESCALGALDSDLTDKKLKEFYANDYREVGKPKLEENSDAKELFDIYSKFQTDRINFLKPYFRKDKTLLEVGCSSGMFLYHAKKYVKEVVGIDYDIQSAEFAREKCKCRVYTTDIEETDLARKSFDIIAIFQTLEHVEDPKKLIATLKKYLKPDGVIAIEVPNLHDALAHVYDLPNHRKFYFHSSHLWYFTEKSLQKLMEDLDFDGSVSYVQDYNFLNHIHWLDQDAPDADPIRGLSKPTLPFRADVDEQIKERLSQFIEDADARYKKELAELGITSNLFYIGIPSVLE